MGFAWGPAESCWFSLGRCCYEKRGGKPERGRRRRWGDAGIVPFFPELPGGVTSPRWLAGCSFQLLSLARAFLFDSAWLLVVVTLGHRALGWALSPRADACAGHMSRNTLLFFLPAFPFFFFSFHTVCYLGYRKLFVAPVPGSDYCVSLFCLACALRCPCHPLFRAYSLFFVFIYVDARVMSRAEEVKREGSVPCGPWGHPMCNSRGTAGSCAWGTGLLPDFFAVAI